MMSFFKPEDFIALPGKESYFYAADCLAAYANKLLRERGTVVCAHRGPSNAEGVWIAKPYEDRDSTHTALLVCIEPIKRETAEDILREMIADADPQISKHKERLERARRVLEK